MVAKIARVIGLGLPLPQAVLQAAEFMPCGEVNVWRDDDTGALLLEPAETQGQLPLQVELFLMLRVGIVARDRDCSLQVLHSIATVLDERIGLSVLRSMAQTCDPDQLNFLRSLY